MSSDDTFSHTPHIEALIEQSCVLVWRLPVEFSQSRFGGRELPSNACTLIVIQLAELIHRNDIGMTYRGQPLLPSISLSYDDHHHGLDRLSAGTAIWSQLESFKCSPLLLTSFVEAILLGNTLHENALEKRKSQSELKENVDPNFTIPDALIASRHSFKEIDFCNVNGYIKRHLPRQLNHVIRNPQLASQARIFVIMIAYQRSVLFIYERSSHTLTLFDTHLHGSFQGGLIASCRVADLQNFCEWISFHIFPESMGYNRNKLVPLKVDFELSALHFCGNVDDKDCLPLFDSPLPSPLSLFHVSPAVVAVDKEIQVRTLKRAAYVKEVVHVPTKIPLRDISNDQSFSSH